LIAKTDKAHQMRKKPELRRSEEPEMLLLSLSLGMLEVRPVVTAIEERTKSRGFARNVEREESRKKGMRRNAGEGSLHIDGSE